MVKFCTYVAFLTVLKSIIDEEWSPTGVPTIFRMIDKLNRSKVELKLILTVKDGFSII